MTETLTIKLARETLFKVVMEQGADYKYQRPGGEQVCYNVYDGKGSCLIGRMFVALGVPVDWMERHCQTNGASATLSIVTNGGFLNRPFEGEYPDLENYLVKVQGAQDAHEDNRPLRNWGECLAIGDEYLRLRNRL